MSSIDGVGDFLSSITVGLLWTYFSPTFGFLFGGILAALAEFSPNFTQENYILNFKILCPNSWDHYRQTSFLQHGQNFISA